MRVRFQLQLRLRVARRPAHPVRHLTSLVNRTDRCSRARSWLGRPGEE